MSGENKKRSPLQYLPYLLIPILLIGAAFWYASNNTEKETSQYYQIVSKFNENKISKFTLNLSSGVLVYYEGDEKTPHKYAVPNVELFINDIHDSVNKYNVAHPDDPVEYDYKKGSESSWLLSVLPSAVLFIFLIIITLVMFRRMNATVNSENNRALNFGKVRTKSSGDEKRKTTFEDVAGADEEKEELEEIVEFLRNPQKFRDIGARIPKGVLLVGPPGTGKTLLARAVAGEADVPFFSISGSDFVEMYVGVGASRVRDLFDKAKKQSPSIIFIDEIDAVGRHRGAGMGGGHDEREQTLNQLLVEMDGFGANEGVIIIAATNRPDILDPALLRPGRFDRQVTVNAPDLKGREAILKVHARNKSFGPDCDLSVIARSTAGFTGADLENLLNEAALLAARRGKKAITMPEIEEATVKVMVGTEKKSHKMNEKEKRITAYHEAGHAVATYYLSETQDAVHEISIIPRGLAGGYTMSIPAEDKSYVTKNYMLDNIVTLLGGRVSEDIIFKDISTGASNDIQRATEIARSMVTKYGMSEKLGPIAYTSGNDEVFLGRDLGHSRNYSEDIAGEIDNEINSIVVNAYSRCEKILTDHIDRLHKIAEYLISNEKMTGKQFADMMSEDFTLDTNPLTDSVTES